MFFVTVATGCGGSERQHAAADDPPATAHERPATLPQIATDAEGPAEFHGTLDGEEVRLTLVTLRPGPVSGVLAGLEQPLFLTGERVGDRIVGEVSARKQRVPFEGTLAVRELLLRIGADGADEDDVLLARLERRDASAADATAGVPAAAAAGAGHVRVNGQDIPAPQRATLERDHRLSMLPGDYWYDRVSGAWGHVGGPTAGYLQPWLPLGGPLRPDASGGSTPVFVNGRALHPADLFQLQQIVGALAPGRYSLDAQGTLGIEGGPPLVNLVAVVQAYLAQMAQGGGPGPAGGGAPGPGGDGGFRSGITGVGGNESGGSGYVMGEGWSVSY
jgi:hypothetical protein